MKFRMRYQIALLLLCVVGYLPTRAQQNMTLYQMHDIIQSNSLNPAIPALCKWTVGFPGLGSISIAASTPISYNDLGPGKPTVDVGKILSELKSTNAVSTNNSINLLMIGYRAPSTYWQFTVNERVSAMGSINRDPVELLLRGNGPFVGQEVMGDAGVNALHYREYALSVSHDFGSDLWLGIRPKLLFGRLGISSTDNKASLYTDPTTYALTMTSDFLIRASAPGQPVMDPVRGTVNDFETDLQASDFGFNTSNVGVGADLGMSKLMGNGWKISASLLNIGRISWSKNTHVFTQRTTVKYAGPTSGITNWDDLADTLKSVIRLDYGGEESFSQWLSPVAMFGASYPLAEKIRVGVTGMTEFQPNHMPWAVTATAFTEGTSIVSAALSYTVTQSSLVNIGLGAGLHLGSFNIHLLTDNIVAAFAPFGQRYATLQMGINFRFGCGGDSGGGKSKGDLPCAAYRGIVSSEGGKKRGCVPCSKIDKKGKR